MCTKKFCNNLVTFLVTFINLSMPVNNISIRIPVRPHLKPFLETHFGKTLCLNGYNTVGIFILSLLEKKTTINYSNSQIAEQKRTYSEEVICSISYRNASTKGFILTPDKTILINRFIDDYFNICLHHFVRTNLNIKNIVDKGRKEAIYKFAELNNIEIDNHISFDSIEKRESRIETYYQQKYFNNSLPNLSLHKKAPLRTFL